MTRPLPRKFHHTITGNGTGWAVADKNNLVGGVNGALVGVLFRSVSGAGLTLVPHVFDGQPEVGDVPLADDFIAYRGLSTSPTVSATDAFENQRFVDGEPFSDGLTPAVNVTAGSGDWEIAVTLFVDLAG